MLPLNEGVVQERKLVPQSISSTQDYLILDTFTRGQIFGFSSLRREGRCRFTFEVRSKKAQVLKIHRQLFLDYFGGELGEPMMQLHGINKSIHNWLKFKLDSLAKMNASQLASLPYQNKKYYEIEKLKPTITTIKEVPFTKNILQQNLQQTLDKSAQD